MERRVTSSSVLYTRLPAFAKLRDGTGKARTVLRKAYRVFAACLAYAGSGGTASATVLSLHAPAHGAPDGALHELALHLFGWHRDFDGFFLFD
ncbi:hypothetical protein A2704_03980 [Candidatus Kaiserbacteria bacterium RIFCSPHIGHO2_01_FULL_54_36b]|uniref:Uncharacterized protein n=1 Tax=Candidatus Kaiserbacteria bacterium RIFCSPHIGHO2_01_FULL_54_36b TaxID=1798483 RepID=A0A1F6CPE6_9BACT|nr:MAG: hypothetical protein A2704_03980 [Candidatus Kaiserbacteria bacterium RIFCSPHIGHO2_01_FULL_54_36b]